MGKDLEESSKNQCNSLIMYFFPGSVCKRTSTVRGYNVFASGLVDPSIGDSLLPKLNDLENTQAADIFRPTLALPVTACARVTQKQAALHLLCCLETLTRCQQVSYCRSYCCRRSC